MPRSLAIDTHTHCFTRADDPAFPYPPEAPYRPSGAASPEHLLACMDAAGVDRAIIVHPEPYQEDHRYLDYCLDAGRGRFKGTCRFFAERPGSVERMTELVERRPGEIVAVRIHAYAPERLPPFGTTALRDLWRHAGDLGLAVQLHFEPRYAPGFEPLIREFSGTMVIVDHLGRPFQGSPKDHAVVFGWAKLPNVVMKLSLLPRKDEYPHRDIGPIVASLIDAFGPDRLLTGTNFGAGMSVEAYRAERDRLLPFLDKLSLEDRGKILGATAARLFGFGPVLRG
jgi:predicted TIM-barrel fold metal-dependent hydrolase